MLTAFCHCRAVLIEVDRQPAYLNECHCSICRRYGVLWGYYHPDRVRIIAEPGATEGYRWGAATLEFRRCRTCGCVTHWQALDGKATRMGINARLMEPADIANVPVRHSDGPSG